MDDSLSALNPFSLLPPTAHPASVAELRRMFVSIRASTRLTAERGVSKLAGWFGGVGFGS